MLRTRVFAVACLAVLPSAFTTVSAVAADAASTALVVDTSNSSSPVTAATGDGKPHISVAATVPAEGAATAAPDAPTDNAGTTARKIEITVTPEAVAKPAPPPTPTLTAQIDLGNQTMTVSEDGVVKHTWAISSGTSEFPTPRGTFRPQWVAKMWYSRKYDNAPMPNAVFIHGGVAIHATPHVGRLGTAASHGCIRLAPSNAKVFYGLVQKHGMKATRVSVFGTPKWRAPAVASRKPQQRYAAQQDDSGYWWSSSKPTQAVSAYDPRFTQRRARPAPPPGYRYVDRPSKYVVYRTPQGARVVYAQPRAQRKVYYNASGYGYSW